jgi:hypothetical protein
MNACFVDWAGCERYASSCWAIKPDKKCFLANFRVSTIRSYDESRMTDGEGQPRGLYGCSP